MDIISSISFPNELLISWTFLGHFCHHFWVAATAKQQQTHPKVMTKMFKKCSTDQRFIRKRNTTYKIHTLVRKPGRKFYYFYKKMIARKNKTTKQTGFWGSGCAKPKNCQLKKIHLNIKTHCCFTSLSHMHKKKS